MLVCLECAAVCDEAQRFCTTCGADVDEARSDPMIGRTLPGGYVILSVAGVGGMGRVYLAEQTALARTVAVKVIHPHLVNDEATAARFILEARAASRLNHPNSLAVFDFGRTESRELYLVMERLRGKDLARVLEVEGVIAFPRVVDILQQVLGALDEGHNLGIVHRDLKPENLVLETLRSGREFVKVVDFGLAKMHDATEEAASRPGLPCGTPEYMSPEQARGDALDGRSDLYAVGVILYQLLTGQVPFVGATPARTMVMQLQDAVPDPRLVAPERQIPDALADVTLIALAKDPERRFPTARAFADALDDALVSFEPKSAPMTSGVRCRRCTTINPLFHKFCGDCGGLLDTSMGARSSAPPTPRMAVSGSVHPEHPTMPRMESFGRTPSLLIGRADDVAWLESRREDACAMPCGAAIVGDDGSGKTRLLQEFAARCESRGDVVVATTPDPAWSEVCGYALCEAIRKLADLPGATPTQTWPLASARARRGLLELFGDPPEVIPADPPAVRRAAMADALRWGIARASERGGARLVVLVVDDLEDLDGVSRNAFLDVVADPPLLRLLIVIAHTPNARAFLASPLVGPAETRSLGLLSAEEASRLLDRKAMGAMRPMHATQLKIFQRDFPTAKTPSSLEELVSVRVGRLAESERQILQAIAVGADDEESLRRISGVYGSLSEPRARLEHLGLLSSKGTLHPIVRRAALGSMPAAVRMASHAAALELAEKRDAPAEVRALHAFHAGRAFVALVLLDRIAMDRLAWGDYSGAITALSRAVALARRELLRGEIDDPERALVLFSRKLADALKGSGALADAEGVLREVLDLVGPAERGEIVSLLRSVTAERERSGPTESLAALLGRRAS